MITMKGSMAGVVPIIGVNVPTAAAMSGGAMGGANGNAGAGSVVAKVFTLTSSVSTIETVAVTIWPTPALKTVGSPFPAIVTPLLSGLAEGSTSSDALYSDTVKLIDGTNRLLFIPNGVVLTKIVCSVTPGAKVSVPLGFAE